MKSRKAALLFELIRACAALVSITCLVTVATMKDREMEARVLKALHSPSSNMEENSKLMELGETPLVVTTTDHHQQQYSPADPWKQILLERLDRVRAACGILCTINDKENLDKFTVNIGQSFRELSVPVHCESIMMNHNDIDATMTDDNNRKKMMAYPPPHELVPYFSMHGLVEYSLHHPNQQEQQQQQQTQESTMSASTWAPHWTKDVVNQFIQNHWEGKIIYEPQGMATNELARKLSDSKIVPGSRVLVVGTEWPWIEAICLSLGASHVTSIVHRRVVNQHPQITTLSVSKFLNHYQYGGIELYDLVISFSVDHLGLGKEGEAIDPWTDVLTVARMWCVTKAGGYLALGVPVGQVDSVQFNDYRVYGQHRFPLLTANWMQIDGPSLESLPTSLSEPVRHVFMFQKHGKENT